VPNTNFPVALPAVNWSAHIHHWHEIHPHATLEAAFESMSKWLIEFAPILDEDGRCSSLVSSRRLMAVLSSKYGPALYSQRQVRMADVPCCLLAGRGQEPDGLGRSPICIPREQVIYINPQMSFFHVQALFEKRINEHYFDDMIVVDEAGTYLGMLSARNFGLIQDEVLQWQRTEIEERAHHLEETLHRLSETQEELIGQAKMASLGELVAGIAHEINTPLGVLLSSREALAPAIDRILESDCGASRERYERMIQTNLNLGRQAGERIAKIVHSLRTFARQDADERVVADIAQILHNTLVLVSHQFKQGITFDLDLEDGAELSCYPGPLSQVLLNILTNAYQAMEGAGKIFITLKRQQNLFRLTIRDTGPGIPPEILSRIFDPGFTTKGVGVGTGLGLSISKRIIEQQHAGQLRVLSGAGGGAEFVIEIPDPAFTSPENPL
jgi:signal transduction histidine kinase